MGNVQHVMLFPTSQTIGFLSFTSENKVMESFILSTTVLLSITSSSMTVVKLILSTMFFNQENLTPSLQVSKCLLEVHMLLLLWTISITSVLDLAQGLTHQDFLLNLNFALEA